jgi:hypothetical protein
MEVEKEKERGTKSTILAALTLISKMAFIIHKNTLFFNRPASHTFEWQTASRYVSAISHCNCGALENLRKICNTVFQ